MDSPFNKMMAAEIAALENQLHELWDEEEVLNQGQKEVERKTLANHYTAEEALEQLDRALGERQANLDKQGDILERMRMLLIQVFGDATYFPKIHRHRFPTFREVVAQELARRQQESECDEQSTT